MFFQVGFDSLLCIFFTFHRATCCAVVHQAGLQSVDIRTAFCFILLLSVTKVIVKWTTESVSVQLQATPVSSYGLDIDKVAMLGPLPQGLDPLQLAAVKREA